MVFDRGSGRIPSTGFKGFVRRTGLVLANLIGVTTMSIGGAQPPQPPQPATGAPAPSAPAKPNAPERNAPSPTENIPNRAERESRRDRRSEMSRPRGRGPLGGLRPEGLPMIGVLEDKDRIFTNLYRDGDPFIQGALKRVRSC